MLKESAYCNLIKEYKALSFYKIKYIKYDDIINFC